MSCLSEKYNEREFNKDVSPTQMLLFIPCKQTTLLRLPKCLMCALRPEEDTDQNRDYDTQEHGRRDGDYSSEVELSQRQSTLLRQDDHDHDVGEGASYMRI